MSKLPPPVPFYGTTDADNSGASRTATISLFAPLLAIALGLLWQHLGTHVRGIYQPIGMLGVSGLSFILIVVGPILGIVALLIAKPGGRTGIAIRSLGGLALSGLLISMMMPSVVHSFVQGFKKGRADALARQAAIQSVGSGESQANGGNETALMNGGIVRARSVDDAARATSGPQALVLKGNAAYLRQEQAVETDYQSACRELTAAHVLATSNLVDRQTIQDRETLVLRFLNSNEAVRDFIKRGENVYRAELVAEQVPSGMIDAAVVKYRGTTGAEQPAILKVREQDERMGRAMLGVLDLLDANWGHWHYVTGANPHLHFESRTVLEQYNEYLDQIADAQQTSVVSQRQLAVVVQRAPLN